MHISATLEIMKAGLILQTLRGHGYTLSINNLLQNLILFRAAIRLIKIIISLVSLHVGGPFDITLGNDDIVGSRWRGCCFLNKKARSRKRKPFVLPRFRM